MPQEGVNPQPRVVFRPYSGHEDIPHMVRIKVQSYTADLVDAIATEQSVREDLDNPIGFDPRSDIAIVETDGLPIGFCQVASTAELDNTRIYFQHTYLMPEWRRDGIREEMLRRNEARAAHIMSSMFPDERSFLETFAAHEDNDWKRLLERSGYEPARHLLELVRRNLKDLEEMPLPDGVEVRPVRPEDYRKVWDATREALKDERFYREEKWSDEAFQKDITSELFQPELWEIAWAGDDVVGGVHNFIDHDENRDLGRNWGHTEQIFVSRGWRGKGIAKALIARSLTRLDGCGVEAATLDVDTDNPSGAMHLYARMGYTKERHFIFYRKEMPRQTPS